MANPSTPMRIGGGRKSSFTPSATEFAPKMVDSKREVLRASFVTQTVPNVPPYAGIVGLCTVPEEKAGMEHLGWHIADFLAFRALLCGENNPKAQSWLAMCDIPTLAQENPERYVHGKERRLVGIAASPTKVKTPTGLVEREDNIQVETSAEVMKDKFIASVKKKLPVLKKHGYPLFLIICGLTSLEQDIYFGLLDVDHRYTMKEFREDLGDEITHIDVTVVTPSLFSAGWQINTSLGRLNSTEVCGSRVEFLARQFGGLFAGDLVRNFLGWQCPVIDETKLDPQIKSRERFPGPVVLSEEVKALTSQLEIKIQSSLLGELSASPMDHSFSFDKNEDEWDALIRSRENQRDYRPLGWYERKWDELPSTQNPVSPDKGFEFLGGAFGGTKTSQVNHLRYLIEESYLAWPDHWSSTFGQETKKDFERFRITYVPDSLDCLEIFNILEHRARTSILGDRTIEYFDLPMPDNKRCRDCNVYKLKQQLPETARRSLTSHFGTVLMSLPGPNVPPGVNPNNMSRLQQRLENCRGYIRASLAIRFLASKSSSQIAIDRIENFMQEAKQKQLELLAANVEIHELCCRWLNAIGIPVRDLPSAVTAARTSKSCSVLENGIGILDSDDEYEVYQDDSKPFGSLATPTSVKPHSVDVCDQPPSSLPSTPAPVAPALEQRPFTPERSVEAATGPPREIITTSPMNEITQIPQEAAMGISQEQLEFEAQQARLINELQTAIERGKREELAKKLLALFERDSHSAANVESDQSAHSVNGGAPNLLVTHVEESVSKGEEEIHMEQKRAEIVNIKEVQDNLENAVLDEGRKTESIIRRQTPPHLRGICR